MRGAFLVLMLVNVSVLSAAENAQCPSEAVSSRLTVAKVITSGTYDGNPMWGLSNEANWYWVKPSPTQQKPPMTGASMEVRMCPEMLKDALGSTAWFIEYPGGHS